MRTGGSSAEEEPVGSSSGLGRLLDGLEHLFLPSLIGLLFAAPLLLEGIPSVCALLVQLLLLLTVGSWLMLRLATPFPGPLSLRCLTPLFLLPLLAFFQTVPLPASIVTRLSPAWNALATGSLALVPTSQRPGFFPLSLSAGETLQDAIRITLALLLVLASYDRLRAPETRRTVLNGLVLAGAAQSVVGFVQWVLDVEGSTGAIYGQTWLVHDIPNFFGSFLGPNRNAAYLNLLWPLAVSLGLESRAQELAERARDVRTSGKRGRREPSGPYLWPWQAYAILATMMLLGVVFCRSRMAWGLILLESLSLGALFAARAGRRRLALMGWTLGTGLMALTIVFFRAQLHSQLALLADKEREVVRPELWAAVWRLGSDHLLTGVGLGAFGKAFGPYNPLELPVMVKFAESVYLELFAELGIVGILAPAATALLVGRRLVARRFWEGGPGRQGVPGLLVGLGGLGCHAAVDLVMRGYGTLVTASVMTGVLLIALEPFESKSFPTSFRYGSPGWKVWWVPGTALVVTAFWSLSAAGNFWVERAEASPEALKPYLEPLQTVTRLSPWTAGAWRWLGTYHAQQAQLLWRTFQDKAASPDEQQKALDSALESSLLAERYLVEALLRTPLTGHTQRLLSRLATLSEAPELARKWAREATRVQPSDYRTWAQLAATESSLGQVDAALLAWKSALARANDGEIETLVRGLVKTAGGNPGRVAQGVPSGGSPLIPIEVGLALEGRGENAAAKGWFEKGLEGPRMRAQPLIDAAWKCIDHQDFELALRLTARVKQDWPQLVVPLMVEAEVLRKRGELEQAVKVLDQAAALARKQGLVREGPPGVYYEVLAVGWLLDAGKLVEAEALANALQAKRPEELRYRVAAAQVLARSGRTDDALLLLIRAVQADTTLEEPRWALVGLYEQLGMAGSAGEALLKCAGLDTAPRCQTEAARRALKAGDAAAARDWLDKATRSGRPSTESLALLWKACSLQGDAACVSGSREKLKSFTRQTPETVVTRLLAR